MIEIILIWILIGIPFILIASIKQINEYERGVRFFIGKYDGIMQPGWRIVIPVIQTYQKVD
ncbi:MAG: slipin family protein, partial [Candidatus Pacebacteria bacterium]|nr:slipin family protein [Candidatus Paceibacterota bacterium]